MAGGGTIQGDVARARFPVRGGGGGVRPDGLCKGQGSDGGAFAFERKKGGATDGCLGFGVRMDGAVEDVRETLQ